MDERQDASVAVQSRERRAEDGELDITPMIDIVFLLLAFFVVVSKMDPSTMVPMPLAKHGESIPEKTAVIVVVAEVDTPEPKVYKGKSQTDSALCTGSIEDIENQLAEFVKSEMEADPLKVAVIIKAEKKVKYRHLVLVKRAVSRSLDVETHFLHVGVEEQ